MSIKGIRFSGENKLDFIIELRKSVNEYFEKNNISKYGSFSLYLKAIFMLLVYLIPFVLMYTGIVSSIWAGLLCWVIAGAGLAGVGMATMHDANHNSFSKNRIINKIMGSTLYFLGGFPVTWRHQHNTLHHGFTNIDGHDEDIDPGAIIRLSPHKPLYRFHKFQHIYAWFFYGLMTIYWITVKDFKQLRNYRKDKAPLSNLFSYKQLLIVLIVTKVVYYGVFLALPIVFLPFAWYWTVIFFIAMHFTSGFILTVIFQTAHVVPTSEYPTPDKEGTMENNWATHQLFTTSDFSHKNHILSWLIGGLNFQVVHHLFPDFSHVHYYKISKILKTIAQKHNLPYYIQPGFFKAVYEHGKMLKLLGKSYTI